MGIRPMRPPADLETLAEKTTAAFQYPENPAWSVQPDEAAGMVNSLRNYRRMWPLVQLIQRFSLALHLVAYAVDHVTWVSPQREIEITVPNWSRSLIEAAEAAEAAGFEHRMHRLRLGLHL